MNTASLLRREMAAAFYGDFRELRAPQAAAIEPILAGANIVLSSGTGSGKTEAALAPLLSRHYIETMRSEDPTILYLVPTRALANDLEKRLAFKLARAGLRVGIRHGDRDDLRSGARPHVLLTTPESLEVLMFRRDTALEKVKAVVIDEVHLLYNTQRGLQLSCLLQRLRLQLGAVQWAALSATVGRLSDVRDFLFGPAEPAVFLQFAAHRSIDAQVRHCANEKQFQQLLSRLTSGASTKLLVFANSRRQCERLAGALQQSLGPQVQVFAHYSSLSPEVRLETEKKFAESRTAVCVATSTLELGIDIGDIDAVLLWGVPGSIESFLQRIGRGNRRSSKTNVICLIPDDVTSSAMDALRFLAMIAAAQVGELPIRRPFELFGAVGQQCVTIIARENGGYTRIADLCRAFEHLSHLGRDSIESVLAELATHDVLQRHPFKNRYGAAEQLYELVDQQFIYGNFGIGSQSVEVRHGALILGTVPAINLLKLHRRAVVRFAGKRWSLREFSVDGIIVEPTNARRGPTLDFTYPGGGGGNDSFLSHKMWELLHTRAVPADLLAPQLRLAVEPIFEQWSAALSGHTIPFQQVPEGLRYVTFGGYLVNKAISLMTTQPVVSANEITLTASRPIDWSKIPTHPGDFAPVFDGLFEATSKQSVFQTFLNPELQRREFLQEWLGDSAIPNALDRLNHSTPVANTFREV